MLKTTYIIVSFCETRIRKMGNQNWLTMETMEEATGLLICLPQVIAQNIIYKYDIYLIIDQNI